MEVEYTHDNGRASSSSSAAAAAAASSASSILAATSSPATSASAPHDGGTRPALRVHWRDVSESSHELLGSARFERLTPEQYRAGGLDRRTESFPHGVPIVVDNGSYEFRAGFATDLDPRCAFTQVNTATMQRMH